MKISLDNKKFANKENTANGEVSGATIFHYRQSGNRIEADYAGGLIIKGHLLGVMTSDNTFSMLYHHINGQGMLRSGQCDTVISINSDGKTELAEKWQWLNGDCSEGTSVLVEI